MGEFKGFMKYDKQYLGELSLVDRLKHHKAYQQRFTKEDASIQGARCMDCGTPFCQTGQQYGRETIGCPIGNYIPEWNDLVYHQDFKTAYERLSETNNFPDFTGRVCPAPCESACVMKINRESIAIKGIERTIIDEAFENGWVAPKVPSRRRDEKVAIVGSGPAGLTAAEELNLLGYQVTIYERARESGGLLMYGIPNMKLDKDVVRRRIKLMEEAGITFINGVEVGVDIDKATLESEYDAIILCTGAQKGRDLPLEGRMGDGIHFAMDYLTEQTQLLNGEIDDITITAKDKNVIIIGAGDTGADCVATALRENCKSIVQFNKYTKLPEAITFIAAYVLAKIEKGLNKVVHDSIKMLVVGPVALLVTGFLAFIIIGPVALLIGTGITSGVTFIFQHAGWLGGAIYGLLYAPLVITGLHHMFLAVDFQLMGSSLGGTYLWPIVAISNICQGSAAFGAWFVYKRRKMVKEEGLALTSGISGMLGVTEPAMFGVNLPLKYPFIAAISTSCVLGAIVGMNNVLGKVGVGGVPAFISIQKEFWPVYLIVTAIAIVVPCILTIVMSHFSKQKAKEIVVD